MPKFSPSDDGKVIDGKIVVFLSPPGAAGDALQSASSTAAAAARSTSTKNALAEERNASAAAQAATLASAAQSGVPFCEECEKARQALKKSSAAS